MTLSNEQKTHTVIVVSQDTDGIHDRIVGVFDSAELAITLLKIDVAGFDLRRDGDARWFYGHLTSGVYEIEYTFECHVINYTEGI